MLLVGAIDLWSGWASFQWASRRRISWMLLTDALGILRRPEKLWDVAGLWFSNVFHVVQWGRSTALVHWPEWVRSREAIPRIASTLPGPIGWTMRFVIFCWALISYHSCPPDHVWSLTRTRVVRFIMSLWSLRECMPRLVREISRRTLRFIMQTGSRAQASSLSWFFGMRVIQFAVCLGYAKTPRVISPFFSLTSMQFAMFLGVKGVASMFEMLVSCSAFREGTSWSITTHRPVRGGS